CPGGRVASAAGPARLGTARPVSVSDRRERLDDGESESRCQPADVVDRLDEGGRRRGAGLVIGGKRDRDAAERALVRQEVAFVKDRGDRLAPACLALEGEVADRERARVRELGHLAQANEAVAAPGRAVDDETVGAVEQLASRLSREERLARPPD